jgi:hypothetical protein
MNVTVVPAPSSTPMSLPSDSQRSFTTKPRTSWYQAMLFCRSSTVKLGATPVKVRPFD